MRVCFIQVPYMVGDDRHGGSKGPPRLVEAGVSRLSSPGVGVSVKRVVRDGPFRDSVGASVMVNKALASIVRQAAVADSLPFVLAGSCDVCMGILSGVEHTGCGIVWIDAHGDFNTPESTLSGLFAGMSLAVITGHCYRNLWAQIGNSTVVPEAVTLLLGVRDLDPAEQERLQRSAIRVVPWREGRPLANVLAALDTLATRVHEVYLHIDLDGLDPKVAPGIVDPPVPGGLSLEDLETVIRETAARFRIKAATLTTYNPELDVDDTTLRTALGIANLVVECAGAGR
jgi:arginase